MKLLSQLLLPLGVACGLGGLAMDGQQLQMSLFAATAFCLFLNNVAKSKEQVKQWNALLGMVENREALDSISELKVQFEHQIQGQEETRRQMVESVVALKEETILLFQGQEKLFSAQWQEEKNRNDFHMELQAEQIEFWERQHKNNNILVDGLKQQNDLYQKWQAQQEKNAKEQQEVLEKQQELAQSLFNEQGEKNREILVELTKMVESLAQQEQLQGDMVELSDAVNKQVQGVAMQIVALGQTLGDQVNLSTQMKEHLEKQDALQTQVLANAKLLEDTLSEKAGLLLVQGNEAQAGLNKQFDALMQQQKKVVTTIEGKGMSTEQVLRLQGDKTSGQMKSITDLLTSLDDKFIEMNQWEGVIQKVSDHLTIHEANGKHQLDAQEQMVQRLLHSMDDTWKSSVQAIKAEMTQNLEEMNRREESISTVLEEMQTQYKQFETMVNHVTSTMMTMSVEDNKLLHKIFQ